MPIDTIIFDLDGTLLNTLDDIAAAVNHALSAAGLPARSTREVRSFLGNGYKVLIQKSLPEGTPPRTFVEVMTAFQSYYERNCHNATRPYDGIIPCLQQLRARGIRTAIVSNKGNEAVQRLHRRYFANLIDTAVGARPGIPHKPAPDMIHLAMERLHARPATTLYVGDSEVDFETARRAGLASLICLWGFRDREQLTGPGVCLISTPAEILGALG